MTRRTTAHGLTLLLSAAVLTCRPDDVTQHPTLWDGPASDGERVFHDATYSLLWSLGGPDDTLLARPAFLRPYDREVVLFDRGDSRLISFDAASGEVLWLMGGPGQGPGEFSRDVVDFTRSQDGTLHVYDRSNQRLTHRSLGGALSVTPLGSDIPPASGIVTLPDDDFVLFARNSDEPLLHLDRSGRVRDRRALNWSGFSDLHPLARSGAIAEEGERWLYYVHYGNGWFPFEGSRPLDYIGQLVEHREFAHVVVTTNNASRRSTVIDPQCGACSVSIDGPSIYVLHGGSTDDWQAILDVYDWSSGSYRHSYRLPRRYQDAVVSNGTVYGIYSDPHPTVDAMTLSDPALPDLTMTPNQQESTAPPLR